MLIDVTRELANYDGKPIKVGEGEGTATVRDLLEFVLVNTRDSKHQTAEQKYGLYKLLTRIHEAKSKVSIKADEVVTLKELAAPMLNVPVMGAFCDALEGKLEVVNEPETEQFQEEG